MNLFIFALPHRSESVYVGKLSNFSARPRNSCGSEATEIESPHVRAPPSRRSLVRRWKLNYSLPSSIRASLFLFPAAAPAPPHFTHPRRFPLARSLHPKADVFHHLVVGQFGRGAPHKSRLPELQTTQRVSHFYVWYPKLGNQQTL